MLKRKTGILNQIDIKLFLSTVFLCIIGLVILKSASLSTGTNDIIISQLVATIVGFIFIFILVLVDYRVWNKLYLVVYGISIAILIYTLIFGFGKEEWGANSWIRLGGFRFQPSEFVKIAFIIFVSAYLERNKDTINDKQTIIKLLLYSAVPIGLIAIQPDFGTAMVFVFILIIMLFVAGLSWKYFATVGTIGLVSLPITGPLLWYKLDTYQKNRILDWLNPTRSTTGSGYQVLEGKIAVGSGRLTGRGLFKGTQTQYNFVPSKQTDFIFPVLVEELGFIGGITVIALYALLIYRMFDIAHKSTDLFGTLLVTGFTALFIIHIWENIGMTMGLMPVTGIPLPFISHGGTFQVANLICIGLALSVARYRMKGYY